MRISDWSQTCALPIWSDLSDRAVGRYGPARQSADLPDGGQRGRNLAAPRFWAGGGALVRAANRGSLTDDFRDHPRKNTNGRKDNAVDRKSTRLNSSH